MFTYIPMRAGSPLAPNERRTTCAKCGEKLFYPTVTSDTQGAYCGECRHLLRLRYSVSYNLEHRGCPLGNDYGHRLKEEREYYYAKPVERWYETKHYPSSPHWINNKEKLKSQGWPWLN